LTLASLSAIPKIILNSFSVQGFKLKALSFARIGSLEFFFRKVAFFSFVYLTLAILYCIFFLLAVNKMTSIPPLKRPTGSAGKQHSGTEPKQSPPTSAPSSGFPAIGQQHNCSNASHSIVVGVRVRGFKPKEERVLAVRMSHNTCQLTTEQKGKQKFTFDHCFWSNDVEDESMPYATQTDVFQAMGQPLVDNVLDGYNCCLLAYGPTGSGKTYSMFGKGSDSKVAAEIGSPAGVAPCNSHNASGSGEDDVADDGGDSTCSFGNVYAPKHHSSSGLGLIPRLCDELFTRLRKREADQSAEGAGAGGSSFTVTMSMIEIYQDDVFDLLSDQRKELVIRNSTADGRKHYFLSGVTTQQVAYFEDIEKLLLQAERRKTIHATAKNAQSSRAHTLVELLVQQKDRQGKILVADLAGSENAKESQSEGLAFEQLKAINLSLMSLGKCIEAASRGYDPDTILAFKDSTLTKLLKEYIGGNSKTSILLTIAPGPSDARFSIQALRFGDRAKHIVNHAQINNVLPSEQVITSSLSSELSGGGSTQSRVYLYYGTKDYAVNQLQGQLKAIMRQEQAMRSTIELEEKKFAMATRRQEERDFVQAVKVEEARRKKQQQQQQQQQQLLLAAGQAAAGNTGGSGTAAAAGAQPNRRGRSTQLLPTGAGKRFASAPKQPQGGVGPDGNLLPPNAPDFNAGNIAAGAKRATSLPPTGARMQQAKPAEPQPLLISIPPTTPPPKAISPRNRHRPPHVDMSLSDVAAVLDDDDDDAYQRLNTAEKKSRRRRNVLPGNSAVASAGSSSSHGPGSAGSNTNTNSNSNSNSNSPTGSLQNQPFPEKPPPLKYAGKAPLAEVPLHSSSQLTSPVRVATPPPAKDSDGSGRRGRRNLTSPAGGTSRSLVSALQAEESSEMIKRVMIDSEEQQARKRILAQSPFPEKSTREPSAASSSKGGASAAKTRKKAALLPPPLPPPPVLEATLPPVSSPPRLPIFPPLTSTPGGSDVLTPQRKTIEPERKGAAQGTPAGDDAPSSSARKGLRPSPPPKTAVTPQEPQRAAPNRTRQLRSLADHEPQERDVIVKEEETARKAIVDKRRFAAVSIAISAVSASSPRKSSAGSSSRKSSGASSPTVAGESRNSITALGPPALPRRLFRPLHEQEVAAREAIAKQEGEAWRAAERGMKSQLRLAAASNQSPPPAESPRGVSPGVNAGGLRRYLRTLSEQEDEARTQLAAAEHEGRKGLDQRFRSLLIAARQQEAQQSPPVSPTSLVPRKLVRPLLEDELSQREAVEAEEAVELDEIVEQLRTAATAMLDILGQRFVRFAVQQGAVRPELVEEYNRVMFGPRDTASHWCLPLSEYESVVVLSQLWRRRRESALLGPRALMTSSFLSPSKLTAGGGPDQGAIDTIVSKQFEKAAQLAKSLIIVDDAFSDGDDGDASSPPSPAIAINRPADVEADLEASGDPSPFEMSPSFANTQPRIDDFEIDVGSPRDRRQQRLVSFLGDFKLHTSTDLPDHAKHRNSADGLLAPAIKPGAKPSQPRVELPVILTKEDLHALPGGDGNSRYDEDETDSRLSAEESQDPLDDFDFDGQTDYYILPEIVEVRKIFSKIFEGESSANEEEPMTPGTVKSLDANEEQCSNLLTDMAATISDRRTQVLAGDPAQVLTIEQAVQTVGDFFVELILQTDEHRSNVAVVRALLQCARQDRLVPSISLLELSEKRELLLAATVDASLHFLRLLLQQYQVSKLYPRGALCGISLEKVVRSAMDHPVHRIRMVQILLKYCTQKAAFPTLSRALQKAAPDLAPDWAQFFADICSEARANPGENRANRLHVARAMLGLIDYTELDPLLEGPDKLRIFDRAAMEGDLDVLHIFKDCLPPHTFAELILSSNSDGSNSLILGVLANDIEVVTFVIDELRELVPEYREEVKGVLRKEHQGGHALKLARTLRRENAMIRLLAEPYSALRIA
jgi:hypothetical protein